MSVFKDFYQADFARIVRDLETELDSEYPDWQRVLSKADDLTNLALFALKQEKTNGLVGQG